MKNFDIFISHIHSEREYANELKSRIQSDFARFDIFVSSDDESTEPGLLTIQIIEALKISKFVVVLCSEDSILRPWVAFETGIAHALGNEPILLCYAGMTATEIPSPFSQFLVRPMSYEALKWLYKQISGKFDGRTVPSDTVARSYALLEETEEKQRKRKVYLGKINACNAVGAFVYRYRDDKSIEILLIRTKDLSRHIIPKGSVPKTADNREILNNELMEEAGVIGKVIDSIDPSIVSYTKGDGKVQNIAIYAVSFTSQSQPLEKDRDPKWFQFKKALKILQKGRERETYEPLCGALTKLWEDIKNV